MTGSDAQAAPAATLVIFGGTGDLTRRLLVPALVNLAAEGLIGDGLDLLAIGSREGDDESLRETLDEFVAGRGEPWAKLRARTRFLQGDFTDAGLFEALKTQLPPGNAAFYLATPPQFFGPVTEQLSAAGLMDESSGFRRVVIEKPFGHDLASARALNEQLLACVPETQIYRIDHFLGKETVQNILVARFANPLLEAVWNSRYIDHVQITAAETVDVGTRGSFYDATGALRDMVPNHLFQLLAMVGMEPPNSFDAEAVRNEKAKVLAAVRPIYPADAARGRYDGGAIGERTVMPYRETADVAPDSTTETYAAVKLEVATWRWAGVPFYLRTGKALSARDTEVVVQFRPVPIALFRDGGDTPLPPNQLVIQIQPNEGMTFGFLAKRPGPVVEVAPVEMRFRYADYFTVTGRTGYETLLYDALMGDQTLFQRADMIESGWAAVDAIVKAWSAASDMPEPYAPGSAGPAGSDALLERDGRQWNAIGDAG